MESGWSSNLDIFARNTSIKENIELLVYIHHVRSFIRNKTEDADQHQRSDVLYLLHKGDFRQENQTTNTIQPAKEQNIRGDITQRTRNWEQETYMRQAEEIIDA